MSPDKPLCFCYCELPSKRRKLCITLTPIALEIILCFSPHGPEDKGLCLATLSIEKTSDGSDKSITSAITWTLEKSYWILIRFACLSFIVTKIKLTVRNTSSTGFSLTMCFVLKLLTLQKQGRR